MFWTIYATTSLVWCSSHHYFMNNCSALTQNPPYSARPPFKGDKWGIINYNVIKVNLLGKWTMLADIFPCSLCPSGAKSLYIVMLSTILLYMTYVLTKIWSVILYSDCRVPDDYMKLNYSAVNYKYIKSMNSWKRQCGRTENISESESYIINLNINLVSK